MPYCIGKIVDFNFRLERHRHTVADNDQAKAITSIEEASLKNNIKMAIGLNREDVTKNLIAVATQFLTPRIHASLLPDFSIGIKFSETDNDDLVWENNFAGSITYVDVISKEQ